MDSYTESEKHRQAERKAWLDTHTLQFLMQSARMCGVATILTVLMSSWLNWEVVLATTLAKAWMAFALSMGTIGLLQDLAYKHHRDWFNDTQWLMIYRVMLIGGGLGYGILPFAFLPHLALAQQALILLIVIGMAASSIATLAADQWSYRCFVWPIALLTCLCCALSGDANLQVFAGVAFAFMVILDVVSKRVTDAIRENIRLVYEMKVRASYDSLVGLYNRTEFEAQYELKAASASSLGLLLIDLDHFKPLNDSLGHQAGDQALMAVGDILRRVVEDSAVVSRLGGDEFAVLYVNQPQSHVVFAEKTIINDINRLNIGGYKGLSASAGICMSNSNIPPFSVLMREADAALYASKDAGRDCVTHRAYSEVAI